MFTSPTLLMFLLLCLTANQIIAQCGFNPNWTHYNETCLDYNDGQICCSPSGGTGPFSCTISPVAGTQVGSCFVGLPPSTTPYTVTITDGNGCQVPGVFTIIGNDYPAVVITPSSVPTCGGSGSACVSVTGGSGVFNIDWFSDSGFINYIGSGNCITQSAGTYWYRVEDTTPNVPFTECVNSGPVTIASASLTLGPVIPHSATCIEPCNGAIEIDLSTVLLPATISWTGTSSGTTVATSSPFWINGLCPGTYAVTVDDASSCTPVTLSSLAVGTDNADIIITSCSGLVWNPAYFSLQNDVTLGGNLIIAAGACLVIENMTIRLKPGRFIRIEGTGSLTTTNTTYDAGCGDWWQGFEVGSLQPNTLPANRGFLNMDETCVITHASFGISNFHNNGAPVANTSGGRIEVTDTRFVDNNHDLFLQRYYPQGVLIAENRGAFFENCSFELNTYNSNSTSDALIGRGMVQLTSITDVRFFNCRAENFNQTYLKHSSMQLYKSFCLSSFASFLWEGCNQALTNCNNSYIRGYIDAIQCDGDLTLGNLNLTNVFLGPEIRNTTFECYRGIKLSDVSQAEITDNTFSLFNFTSAQLPPNYFWATSVQYFAAVPGQPNPAANAGTEFLFAGNEINFNSPSGNLNPNLAAGILVYNAGEHDSYIIENTFRGCNRAGQFDDRNKGSDLDGLNNALGLHYECNTLIDNRFDFVIRDAAGQEGDDAGVFGRQRRTFDDPTGTFSAGNNFINSANNVNTNDEDDIRNSIPNTSVLHRYVYHLSDLNANGINEFSPAIQVLSSQNPNDCGYNYSSWQPADFTEEIESAQQNYQETKDIYLALLDGGNSELVKGQVENSTLNNAISLYNALMELSPDLSEEVMHKLIQKESEFPTTLLTLVLAANPSAAKSGFLIKALEDRGNSLSQYQMSVIMQGMQNSSPKEMLEEELLSYRMDIEKSRQFLKKYLNNSAAGGDHLQALLETYDENEFLSDRFSKADLLIRNGNAEEGFELMYNATQDFRFSSSEESGILSYTTFLEAEYDILTRTNPELSPAEIEYLEVLYEDDPCGLGYRAYHLLIAFAGYPRVESDCNAPDDLAYRSAKVRIEKGDHTSSYFEAYPNPVQGELIVIRMKHSGFGEGMIKIYGVDGRLLQSFPVSSDSNELIIPSSLLGSGLNRICLYDVDGSVLESKNVLNR